MFGGGSQSATNFAMRSHVNPPFWLRRRSERTRNVVYPKFLNFVEANAQRFVLGRTAKMTPIPGAIDVQAFPCAHWFVHIEGRCTGFRLAGDDNDLPRATRWRNGA
jgi:hypothetical protein